MKRSLPNSLESISIFGLGYVGTVTAACLSSVGRKIVGVDRHSGKVELLNSGKSPIVEPEVGNLLERAHQNGQISATEDTGLAIRNTDATIVCVGTPTDRRGKLVLDFVESVASELSATLSEDLGRKHLVIFRSTMLPGSTREIAETYFSKLISQDKVEVLFAPEFLREGTAVKDFREPSLSVLGTIDGKAPLIQGSDELLGPVAPGIVNWEEAEAVKYACNSFHALKICFANEIGRLSKSLDIDARKVMDSVCSDTVLNISPYYLKPGNPYGGSCLPKDVDALDSLANREGVALPLIRSLRDSNQRHQDLLLDAVIASGKSKVCLLGLTFKSDTDDLRNSPIVALAESLLGKGYEISIFDPQLELARLTGSNKSQAEKSLPHLKELLKSDLASSVKSAELIVVAQRCCDIELLRSCVTPDHHVLDVNSWPELETLPAYYEGFCW